MSTYQIAAVESDLRVEFARQLYDKCLERDGEDHEQTRIAREYVSDLESRHLSALPCGKEYQQAFYQTVRFLLSRGASRGQARKAVESAWRAGWERLQRLRDEELVAAWVNTIALSRVLEEPKRSREPGYQDRFFLL